MSLQTAFGELLLALGQCPPRAEDAALRDYCQRLLHPLDQVGRAIQAADLRHMLLDWRAWDTINTTGNWAQRLLQFSQDPDEQKVFALLSDYVGRGLSFQHLTSHVRRFTDDALAEQARLSGGTKQGEGEKQPSAPYGSQLEVLPGGIKYGNEIVELSGKPLACIRELVDASQNRLNWNTLRNRVWGEDAYTEKNTVKNAIKDARDALRKLARESGMRVDRGYDPLPCVDQGKDLAWKLSFPR